VSLARVTRGVSFDERAHLGYNHMALDQDKFLKMKKTTVLTGHSHTPNKVRGRAQSE